MAILLQWIVEKGNDGSLLIVPPLDKMLGIKPPEVSEQLPGVHKI